VGGRAAKEATMQVNKARERKLGFCVAGVAFGDSRGAFVRAGVAFAYIDVPFL